MPEARPRAVIDTLAVYFPYFSFYPESCIRAGNGISFWRNSAPNKGGKGRYTTLELSRFGSYGIYTPPSKGKHPHEQNKINAPTAKGVNAAIGRLYCGYASVLAEGDRETFIEMWECYGGDSKELGAYMPRITRLDIALDLPPDVAIAAPDDLLYYVRHGRGSGARYIKVATKQGVYFFNKKTGKWTLRRQDSAEKETGPTEPQPYFMRSAGQMRKAVLANEITIYTGTKNGEIKIYAKGGLIRCELSARRTILHKILPDRRIEVLSVPSVLLHIFRTAAARIGELFRRGHRRGRVLRAAGRAINLFLLNFLTRGGIEAGYYIRPAALYNNVFANTPPSPPQRGRPPPFSIRTAVQAQRQALIL